MKIFMLSMGLLVTAVSLHAKISFAQFLLATADQGEADSRLILGVLHLNGWDGTLKPGSTAAHWTELAEELDDQRPWFVLDLLRRGHDRVAQDGGKALSYLTLAAAQGDNYARVILGEILLEGVNGGPPDWGQGMDWIRKSARAGFAPAQFRMGVIYLIGDASTPKDEIEALAWFILAADAGSRIAGEFRDKRTALLGQNAARLAINRSRVLRDTMNGSGGG